MPPIEVAYIPKDKSILKYESDGCLFSSVITEKHSIKYENESNGGKVTIKNNETGYVYETQLRGNSSIKTDEFIITSIDSTAQKTLPSHQKPEK